MDITAFNPQIVTRDAGRLIEMFEALGFEEHHNPEITGDVDVQAVRMKEANGFALDISQPDYPLPGDMIAIRMNVRDFNEAYELLLSYGFQNVYGDKTVDTESSKSAMLISSTGLGINLIEHKRNHE